MPTVAAPERSALHQSMRTRLLRRHSQLIVERSSWISHYQDLSRHLLPRSGRFTVTDRNRGGASKYNSIYDNAGTRAVRVLAAGMMAGASSPARPWFRLGVAESELNDYQPVRMWLDDVVQRMQRVFQRSNVYRMLHQKYEELGVYGTGVSLLLEHDTRVVHSYPIPCGQYTLAQNFEGDIDCLYREFEKTVAEVVKEFGYENVGDNLQQQFDQKNTEAPVRLLHVIEPREDEARDFQSDYAVDMPWRSVYFDLSDNATGVLREGGFEKFPVLPPRWQVFGDDVYGVSPGMDALGDTRQLQQEQLRKGQAIDYKTKPPLQVPGSLKDRESEMFPGGLTYYEPGQMLPFDQVTPHGGIRTAFEVGLELDHLLADIQDVRERIRSAFYADLFLMLATAGPNTRMTATEVAERHEEKLLMLGPVLERLQNELHKPLIDLTFDRMLDMGLLPPPPPELLGVELQVEFISILAQAQRAVGVNNMDRFLVGLQTIVGMGRTDVTDKVNFDLWVEDSADRLGVPAKVIVDQLAVQALRDARSKALAAKDTMLAAAQQAQTAKDLAAAQTTTPSALTSTMQNLTGYDTPAAAGGAGL